jgi:hypothetical protein
MILILSISFVRCFQNKAYGYIASLEAETSGRSCTSKLFVCDVHIFLNARVRNSTCHVIYRRAVIQYTETYDFVDLVQATLF